MEAQTRKSKLMHLSVAIVILNWNGKHYLEKFLPTVVASTYPNLKIVVGDNASTDDSVAFIKTHYPAIEVIINDKNYGFAEGYNRVLQQVTAEYFILLNSDVEVTPNWIEPVIALMEKDPQIAVAQPKIKAFNAKNSFEYAGAAGGFIDKYGYPFCRGRIFDTSEIDTGQYQQPSEIFWASGAAFFIKQRAWQESGGLDAALFAHMEEIDLCWRLKNMEYKIVYCPDSTVYHVGGGTLDASSPFKTYLNFRNNLMIMQKNLPSDKVTHLLVARFFLDFIAWIKFLLSGKIKFSMAITKAHIHFLKNRKNTRLKRSPNIKMLEEHSGVYNKSIVYSYFIKGIKVFSKLPFN